MTQTSPHSDYSDSTKPDANEQELDSLFPGDQAALPDSEDDALTIHDMEGEDTQQFSSLFENGNGETDDTSSSLFGSLPEIDTPPAPIEAVEVIESSSDAPVADPWQNLVSELQENIKAVNATADTNKYFFIV